MKIYPNYIKPTKSNPGPYFRYQNLIEICWAGVEIKRKKMSLIAKKTKKKQCSCRNKKYIEKKEYLVHAN